MDHATHVKHATLVVSRTLAALEAADFSSQARARELSRTGSALASARGERLVLDRVHEAERYLESAASQEDSVLAFTEMHIAALRALGATLAVVPQAPRSRMDSWSHLERIAPWLAHWVPLFRAAAGLRQRTYVGMVPGLPLSVLERYQRAVQIFLQQVRVTVGVQELLLAS